ncbi:MAG TPA: PfkB family carbohydrate kinase [Pseudonocardiaceae bacterium]|nr:PfkB family carbohydrate kinase [Pseudonocardiaceae bacterium]
MRSTEDRTAQIMVFAPAPELTVTVEDRGGVPDLHLHAGSQGVWQARMIASLGVRVSLVVALGGETGTVLRALLTDGAVTLHALEVAARNGGDIHDRRSGERSLLVHAPGDPLDRHELDSLYETALIQGLEAGVAVLSGPTEHGTVPAELYRRLAADLTAGDCRVFADLSGELLDAALAGGVTFLKVSHQELVDDGRAASDEPAQLLAAMRELREAGAQVVVVSRAAEPALAWLPEGMHEVRAPKLQQVDTRGSGDSMTGAAAACVATGSSWAEAVRVGAAAGALNVIRRGLATAAGDDVRVLAERVELRRCEEPA